MKLMNMAVTITRSIRFYFHCGQEGKYKFHIDVGVLAVMGVFVVVSGDCGYFFKMSIYAHDHQSENDTFFSELIHSIDPISMVLDCFQCLFVGCGFV
jgi:hypothetical protein